MRLTPRIKFILDALPLALFFLGFKFLGLFAATLALVIATLVTLLIVYRAERRLAIGPLITAIVVTLFGGLTLWFHDDRFIKMKPTLVSLIFAGLLLGGCLRGKGLLRHALSGAFTLTDRGWVILSFRWGVFFLAIAGLNEMIWRHFPTETWVNFKVFGLMGLTMLFALLQTGCIERHAVKEEGELEK